MDMSKSAFSLSIGSIPFTFLSIFEAVVIGTKPNKIFIRHTHLTAFAPQVRLVTSSQTAIKVTRVLVDAPLRARLLVLLNDTTGVVTEDGLVKARLIGIEQISGLWHSASVQAHEFSVF